MITVQEAAARKGVGVSTIYGAIERGNLTATLVFGRKVLRAADVDAFQLGNYEGRSGVKKRRGPGRPAKPKPAQE